MIRVFVALILPDEIKNSLSLLKGNMRGAKWVSTSDLHLTIRFIGEVTENQLQYIKEELREITSPPITFKLKDLGTFSGRSGPKVIWVGVEPQEELMELRKMVDAALLKANIPLEEKKFRPHVTLARLKGAPFEILAEYLEAGMGFFTRDIEFKEFALFSSKQKEDGPVYSMEEVFPF